MNLANLVKIMKVMTPTKLVTAVAIIVIAILLRLYCRCSDPE